MLSRNLFCVVPNDFNLSGLSTRIEMSSDESDSDEDEENFYTPPASPSLLQTELDSEDEFMDSELPKYDVFMEG